VPVSLELASPAQYRPAYVISNVSKPIGLLHHGPAPFHWSRGP
jgi:hypothetical protein